MNGWIRRYAGGRESQESPKESKEFVADWGYEKEKQDRRGGSVDRGIERKRKHPLGLKQPLSVLGGGSFWFKVA